MSEALDAHPTEGTKGQDKGAPSGAGTQVPAPYKASRTGSTEGQSWGSSRPHEKAKCEEAGSLGGEDPSLVCSGGSKREIIVAWDSKHLLRGAFPATRLFLGRRGLWLRPLLDDTILFPAVWPREGYLGEFLSLPPDWEIPKGRAHVLTPTCALGPETRSTLGHQRSLRKGLKDRQILQSPICKPWGDMTSAPLTLKSHALAQTEGAARAVYPRRREGTRPRT